MFPPTLHSLASARSSVARSSFARSPIYASRLYSRRRVDLRARLVVRWQVDGRMIEVVVHGRTVDLSRTGAGLTLTRELAAGAEVVLCLNLPGGGVPGEPVFGSLGRKPLCLRAVVIRQRGFRAGLRFVEPTAEQRLLLCEFCCC